MPDDEIVAIEEAEPEEEEEVETTECTSCRNDVPSEEIYPCCYRTESGRSIDADLCEDCHAGTMVCLDCNLRVSMGNTSGLGNGHRVCDYCYNEYSQCRSCDDAVAPENVRQARNGDTYCVDCWRERHTDDDEDTSHDDIHSYGYKPGPRFFGTPLLKRKGYGLYFGCELEVNCKDLNAGVEWVQNNLNAGEDHVYMKEDSSISSGGFEIVSHPHSYEEALKLWGKMSQAAPLTSHKSGECGFHIHVTRRALTEMQIQKIIVFVNAPENYMFVTKIAQRAANEYCEVKHKHISGWRNHGDERREAVNMQNDATIEFRIFRGNIRGERLLKNLQFVHALITWVPTVSYRELTTTRFMDYLVKNKKQYKELYGFVMDKPLVATAGKVDI